ncbi:uncharacterized protein At1g26090, chloroplastic [Andrographis paniculata]|uniref:uncharacterized protein At1g26090, chloroplastic n=1 Tax=Andrographis paniculata TaxID=175694 RepID=UPI0021E6E247|nr:uncharacterized protein At1g26090, chloroplastic [Andrographis paniculata]
MASCAVPLLRQSLLCRSTVPDLYTFYPPETPRRRRKSKRFGGLTWTVMAANAVKGEAGYDNPTRLVTFLGKGGSGKTTAAVFAAQHYALSGLKTCLLIHSRDQTAEYLLNCKIGSSSPIKCNDNLSVIRLETTKMILEPLKLLKQADARLNLTQGVLEGVVGEELGVLPGMDSMLSALELERLIGFFGIMTRRNTEKEKFDVVVYDGISTEETIRLIGATSKSRLYLKYLRSLAEKTDLGRVAGPSLLRLADETLNLSGSGANLNGKISSEMWDLLEQRLEKACAIFAEPRKFGCYLVMDPSNSLSVSSALCYWGCVIQAGAQISGAFGVAPEASATEVAELMKLKFSPLHCTFIPHLKIGGDLHWNDILSSSQSNDARALLTDTAETAFLSSVQFDPPNKTVKLFMPGFDKSEIKLYQFRGRSELLVEAGDQRRIVKLPSQIQGKVAGAKFIDRTLVITMR